MYVEYVLSSFVLLRFYNYLAFIDLDIILLRFEVNMKNS